MIVLSNQGITDYYYCSPLPPRGGKYGIIAEDTLYSTQGANIHELELSPKPFLWGLALMVPEVAIQVSKEEKQSKLISNYDAYKKAKRNLISHLPKYFNSID